jgi:muconolactone delta-isomerase
VQFLVELDYVSTGTPFTLETGRAFAEQIILASLARAEQLAEEKTIVAGGPVVGRIALRFVIEAESPAKLDRIISSLPLWTVASTKVTPLTTIADRRQGVQRIVAEAASAARA